MTRVTQILADDVVNKAGRRLVDIIGCFSANSVIAEMSLSQLVHIRTKFRNLNMSISLRLNSLRSIESVLTRWRSGKERRRKVVHPQKEREQYTMESDLDCIVDQFDSDYSECCSESDEDSDDVSENYRQEPEAEFESL